MLTNIIVLKLLEMTAQFNTFYLNVIKFLNII